MLFFPRGLAGFRRLFVSLVLISGIPASAVGIPVVLQGPGSAAPESGPHIARVAHPLPGVVYEWSVAQGAGRLELTQGETVSFRTGAGPRMVLECRATDPATGGTGSGHHPVLILAPAPVAPVSIQAPFLVRKGQEPLVAWVDHPREGITYVWDIEGGHLLSPPDQDHVLFRAGTGDRVTLRCLAALGGVILSQGVHGAGVVDSAPAAVPGFSLEVPAKAVRGKADLEASLVGADEGAWSFRWSVGGGVLQEETGSRARFTAGDGDQLQVRCLATRREDGARRVVGAEILLLPALEPPQVEAPERLFEGQNRWAKVTRLPEGRMLVSWTLEGLEREPMKFMAPHATECRFRVLQPGPARLICRIRNPETGDEQVWSRAYEVRPTRPRIPPARIEAFHSDPPAPWTTQIRVASLRWSLDQVPDSLQLREEVSGRTWDLDPTATSFPLTGPFRGRQRFFLTTILRDRELEEDATDTRSLDRVVPGVEVLAGDVVQVGASYQKAPSPEVTPWGSVTGLAWKSPWLYFSQGDHHTLRRVHPSRGSIEDVAGSRGIPGQGLPGQDRLFAPGQLLHRSFFLPGHGVVEDWLVLQPGANCIQAFVEGQGEPSMRVLVGTFNPVAAKEAQNPRRLKEPSAMAVHAPSGHIFVADTGNRVIKMFSPLGEDPRILASDVEAGGIAVDDQGHVFYSDPAHHVVWVLRNLGPGLDLASAFARPEVFAGALDQGDALDGPRTREARFRQPTGLALDAASLLIADTGNHLIRKVGADPGRPGEVETLGGNADLDAGRFKGMAVHPGGIVAKVEDGGREIRLFSPDGLSACGIPGTRGFRAGGVALDREGNLFFSDPDHHAVRVLRLQNPPLGMDPVYGEPELFAGNPDEPGLSEGGRISGARFRTPEGLELDARDPRFLLISDTGNNVVWKVPVEGSPEGPVKNVGRPVVPEPVPSPGGFVDGSRGRARFSFPRYLCGDGHGRVFVQDQAGNGQSPVIRVIHPDGTVTTLGGHHGNRTKRGRAEGTGVGAGFNAPAGIAVDASGLIYVGDSGNRCVRTIGPDGTVKVAAGSLQDADASAGDDGPAMDARFFSLGSLAVDHPGRLLVVEPRGRRRLRMADLRKARMVPPQAGTVTTIRDNLAGDAVAIFPAASTVEKNYTFVVAEPTGRDGSHVLKVLRNPSMEEVVNPRTRLQALCADRANRIWTILPPDPARPGHLQIQRYSCRLPRVDSQWLPEQASLPLDTGAQGVAGPGGCAEPRITAMAADSHHNVFLADAENGFIWKVDAAMTRVTRVAGQYPYLGPVGRELHDPLPAMQGLAVTPEDDVVVTCGNAVLRITPSDNPPPAPWTECEIKLWTPPVGTRKAGAQAAPQREGLVNEKKDQTWRLSLTRSESRLRQAQNQLQMARASRCSAEIASKADPSSRIHKNRVETLGAVLEQAQKAMALAEAETEAKRAGYAFLKMVDLHDTGGATGKAACEMVARVAVAKASSEGKQASYESLLLIQEREGLNPSHPRWAAVEVRLAYLEAVREVRVADAHRLGLSLEILGLKRGDPAWEEAQERLALAEAAHRQREADLGLAKEAAQAFEKRNPGETIGAFLPWTLDEKGNGPPP